VFYFFRILSSMAVILAPMGFVASSNANVIAHYSFDGSVTADSSGNGYDLSAGGGGPTSVGGQFGNAADFDGSSFLYLNGASNSNFNIGGGTFALSFWYQSDGSAFMPLVGKNNSNADQGYATFASGSQVGGDLRDGTSGTVSAARPTDDGSVFHHIVYQSTGLTQQLYLDGILQATSGTFFPNDAGNAFAIGSRNISTSGAQNSGGASQKLDGRIDEVWVFDRALISDEISNLNEFNSIDGQQVPEPGTIALLGLGLIGLRLGMRRKQQN